MVAGDFFHANDPDLVRRNLLSGLERARTRMAVAMARESKSTTSAVRTRYQQIEARLRAFLKSIRLESAGGAPAWASWDRVTPILSNLPAPPEPGSPLCEIQQLCDCLDEVLEILDATDS